MELDIDLIGSVLPFLQPLSLDEVLNLHTPRDITNNVKKIKSRLTFCSVLCLFWHY